MPQLLLEVVLGFGIGLSLGLLGGGGSILTVPALVYLVGQTPHVALETSLAIVGANSALGASFHRAQGTLNWRVALLFGGTGMVTAYLAANLSHLFPAAVLLVTFAVLMLIVAGVMLTPRANTSDAQRPRPAWVSIASGADVGLMTGLLGVGGGFLIVPALVMLVGLPMPQALVSRAMCLAHWGCSFNCSSLKLIIRKSPPQLL